MTTSVDHLAAVGEAVKSGAIVLTSDGWYDPYQLDHESDRARDLLPPDLTPAVPFHSPCDDRHPESGFWAYCTRRKWHTGRHAAGDGNRVGAVWGDRS